jgi:NADPH:quinone reductase-like Zn-dependent oxidoreductase
MKAAWYDRNGAAREVLAVGELPDPEPGPGEVRVRLAAAAASTTSWTWRSAPTLPFYPLMRRGIVVRMVLVYVMPEDALRSGIEDITELLTKDAFHHPIAARQSRDEIAAAHEAVETGNGIGKIIIRP